VNKINIQPTGLLQVLEAMATNTSLAELRLNENSFCCYFAEYQMLCIQCLPDLEVLDHMHLGSSTHKAKQDFVKTAKNFFGVAVKNHITADGKLMDYVNSVDSFTNGTREYKLNELNRILSSELQITVRTMGQGKSYLLLDRARMMDDEARARRGLFEEPDPVAGDRGRKLSVATATREKKRKEAAAQAKSNAVPLLSSLISEFDEALAGHTKIINSSTIVFEKASHVASMSTDKHELMWADVKVKTSSKISKVDPAVHQAACEELSKTFAEQAALLAERHRDVRTIIVRTLVKFSAVFAHYLGTHCFSSLAVLAQGDDETRKQILACIEEIVIPQIKEGHIMQESTAAIISGIAKLKCDGLENVLPGVTMELCLGYKVVAKTLESSTVKSEKYLLRFKALTSLLEMAVLNREAAVDVIREDLMKSIAEFLASDAFLDNEDCWSYISSAKVAMTCIGHFPDESIDALCKANQLHLRLVKLLNEASQSSVDPQVLKNAIEEDPMALAIPSKIGIVFDLLAEMCRKETVLRDLTTLEPRQSGNEIPLFIQLVLKAPSSTKIADPVHFAGAMRCIRPLLMNPDLQRRYGKYMVNELDLLEKGNKIIGYVTTKHFKVLYKNAERHLYFQNYAGSSSGKMRDATSTVMDLPLATNPFMHEVLVEAVNFLKVFSSLATDEPKDLFNMVSQQFNELGRDSILFNLLKVPSTAVQEAVMRALVDSRLEELDEDEIGQLMLMLNPEVCASEERLLGAVLDCLRGFLEKDGEAADHFRTNHTKSVILQSLRVLATNSARNTFGNLDEEAQKLRLSEKCLSVLTAASYQPMLRKHLRGPVAKDFTRIIKDHEMMDSWHATDICVELTWTGRHSDLLLSCLNPASPTCLRNDRKQAFRVFNRIADVMAGVRDDPEKELPISAEQRAAGEALMWNSTLMRKEANLLDDHAYEDQLEQQLIFFSFSGIERMVHFLEIPKKGAEDDEAKSADENFLRKSDRTIVVELQRKAKDWLQNLMEEAKDLHHTIRQDKKADVEREDPEMAEIDDVTVQEIGNTGETLLREVYSTLAHHHIAEKPDRGDRAEDKAAAAVLAASTALSEVEKTVGRASEGGGEAASLLDDLFKRAQTSSDKLWVPDTCPSSTPSMAARLQTTDHFFVPGSDGVVAPSFFLAAALRTIYAALTLPTTEAVSKVVNFRLKNTMMQLRLVLLLEKCGSYVDGNVAAKLMVILGSVLKLQPDQSRLEPESNNWDHCIGLVIAAGLAGRCMAILTPFMRRLGRDTELSVEQLVLAVEAVGLINTIARAVQHLHVKADPEVQKKVRQAMILHLVPLPTVKAVFLLLLYDMQVNTTSVHGKTITGNLVYKTIRWQRTHQLCVDTIARLIHMAPDIRYEAMELILQYKVMGRNQVHNSFLGDLLDRKETLRLESAMQLLLNAENGDDSERVLQLVWVDLAQETDKSMFASFSKSEEGARLLALTNKRVIVMGKSRHGASKRPCGICPPESFCPVGPNKESAFPLTELTRIICNSDPQLLVLGHIAKTATGALQGEKFLKVIFNQRDSRREFKERLTALSGTNSENRIPVVMDMLVGKTVKRKTTSRIVCTTWAFRESEDEAQGERLSYFVLTELNFFEFKADFDSWLPESENNTEFYASEDDYQGGESDNDELINTINSQAKSKFSQQIIEAAKSARSELFVHERRDREDPSLGERALLRGSRRYQPPPNEWLIQGLGINSHGVGCDTIWDELTPEQIQTDIEERNKAKILSEQKFYQIHGAPKEEQALHERKVIKTAQKAIVTQLFKCPVINLKEVTFEHGELPIVHLGFHPAGGAKEMVTIRFMDDATRERWRRYLQFILFKQSDSQTQWSRGTGEAPGADGRSVRPRSTASAKFFGGD